MLAWASPTLAQDLKLPEGRARFQGRERSQSSNPSLHLHSSSQAPEGVFHLAPQDQVGIELAIDHLLTSRRPWPEGGWDSRAEPHALQSPSTPIQGPATHPGGPLLHPCPHRATHRPWRWVPWPLGCPRSGQQVPRSKIQLLRMAGPPQSRSSGPAQDLAEVVTEKSETTEAHPQGWCAPRCRSWPDQGTSQPGLASKRCAQAGFPFPQSTR